MALQKKKRNTILKFVWKRNQIKALLKPSPVIFSKSIRSTIYNAKRVILTSAIKYLNISYFITKSKFITLEIFKKFKWLNAFAKDSSNIRLQSHFLNSSKLVSFLLNLYDNILRDFSSKKHKKRVQSNKHFFLWKNRDIFIIISKLRRLFKYFFIFIDYFSYSCIEYFFTFYGYAKTLFSNHSRLKFINFLNLPRLTYFSKSKRLSKPVYLLFNKVLTKNSLLDYVVKKELGHYYHKKVFNKNKAKYISFLKSLYIIKNRRLRRLSYFSKFFKLNLTSVGALNKFKHVYSYVNFLSICNFNLKRQSNYPKFLINKVTLLKSYSNKYRMSPSIVSYKKNFNYFTDYDSAFFFNNSHVGGWDKDIVNIFNFKILSSKLRKHILSKYLLFQKHMFSEFAWSWHITFIKSKGCQKNSLNFFSNVRSSDKFMYFFFKIYKLRVVMNFLVFLLLPLNLNLIWAESSSEYSSKQRKLAFLVLKSRANKSNWFFYNKSYWVRIKKWVYGKLKKKKVHNARKNAVTLHSTNSLALIKKSKVFRDFFYKNFFLNLSKCKVSILDNNHKCRNFLGLSTKGLRSSTDLFGSNTYGIVNNTNLNDYFLKLAYCLFKKINKYTFLKKVYRHCRFARRQLWLNFLLNERYEYSSTYIRPDSVLKKNINNIKIPTLFRLLNSKNFICKRFNANTDKRHLYFQNVILYFVQRSDELSALALSIYDWELYFLWNRRIVSLNPIRRLKGKLGVVFINYFLFIGNFINNYNALLHLFNNSVSQVYVYNNILTYFYFVKLRWQFTSK